MFKMLTYYIANDVTGSWAMRYNIYYLKLIQQIVLIHKNARRNEYNETVQLGSYLYIVGKQAIVALSECSRDFLYLKL